MTTAQVSTQLDFSIYGSLWLGAVQQTADLLRQQDEGEALDTLHNAAKQIGEWTPELQAIGLRLLKPGAAWEELVSA